MKSKKRTKHIVIPDTQCKPGVPLEHLEACGNYIVDQEPDVIVHLGDHWDMPSLSSHEKPGSKYFHDKSYKEDCDAGNEGFRLLNAPIEEHIKRTSRRKLPWNPRRIFLYGNHEERIQRTVHNLPILEGAVSYEDLQIPEGWETHDFLNVVTVDGILYSHYFVNPQSALRNVLSGTIDNRLNKIKQSFTQGHQQGRFYGSQFTLTGKELHGLVAGSFYQHDEAYMGPQGNHYWRGIVVKNEVNDGSYDPMFVSLNYLLREWS